METRPETVTMGDGRSRSALLRRLAERPRSDRRPPMSGPARGLGWFSIALGLSQVLAPTGMARLVGLGCARRDRKLMRLVGLRELAAGVGILTQRRPTGWLWARVGGDVMDLALLASALGSRRSDRGRLAAAMTAVAGVTVLDLVTARRLDGRAVERQGRASRAARTITVEGSPEDLYRVWRDLARWPRFMAPLAEITVQGDRSHWRVQGPAGRTVEWDAEITEDRPNERLAWRSLPGADVRNWGEVRFARAPGGRGTEVRLELQYVPPAGALGATIAKLFGREPGQQAAGALRRFKQALETGEVVHSDASIHRGMHPARPSEEGAAP